MAKLILVGFLYAVTIAQAQGPSPFTEGRNAAAAFIGTQNFMIGRMSRECQPVLEKPEAWVKEPVTAWQSRNSRYWRANLNYMTKQLDAALAKGGASVRDRVVAAYSSAVHKDGAGAVDDWFNKSKGSRQEACERFFSFLTEGKFDIRSGGPLSTELDDLVEHFQE
jgi:hypothetical protein